MSRIHPTHSKSNISDYIEEEVGYPSVWTVWNKCSMAFHGTDGFSIYDDKGRLSFRVDNYSRRPKCFTGEVLLMDGQGKALLALRPQILSMHDRWNGYKIEESPVKSAKTISFSMRRKSILQSGDEAEIFMVNQSTTSPLPSYIIQGSFSRRSCTIKGKNGEEIARICRKKIKNSSVTLGEDVFTLIIQPGIECELIMAFVIVLDRIFHKSYGPLLIC